MMLKMCQNRNDDWSFKVKGRLLNVFDLPADDALYYQRCSVNFCTKCNIPTAYSSKDHRQKHKIERTLDMEKTGAFLAKADF